MSDTLSLTLLIRGHVSVAVESQRLFIPGAEGIISILTMLITGTLLLRYRVKNAV
ncbi:MAG: hypothetical protein K8S62_07120 [Candidatus Sabulitectum sp.]|nr:hypothetical protein [Candidatus Sabulitectum sp.]